MTDIENNTWMYGNMKFISRVDQDISQVYKTNVWDIMFNTKNKLRGGRGGVFLKTYLSKDLLE